jgi:hypothetical protein
MKHDELAFDALRCARDDLHVGEHSCVGDQVASQDVVGAVEHNVVCRDELLSIGCAQRGHDWLERDVRVDASRSSG